MTVTCKTASNFIPRPQSHKGYKSLNPTTTVGDTQCLLLGPFGKLLLTERCLLIAQGSKVGIYAYGSSVTTSYNKAVFGALCSSRGATNKVLAKTKQPSRMNPTDQGHRTHNPALVMQWIEKDSLQWCQYSFTNIAFTYTPKLWKKMYV